MNFKKGDGTKLPSVVSSSPERMGNLRVRAAISIMYECMHQKLLVMDYS